MTREEDAVDSLMVANTHDWALFFTNRGRVFSSKVHAIPDASRQAKGIAIINLPGVQVETGEVPKATIVIPGFAAGLYLMLATRNGIVKKTPLEQFEKVRSSGIIAITLNEGDELAWVAVTTGEDDVLLATAQGKLARFHESEIRPMGRVAAGVIGIRLARAGDHVVSMAVAEPTADLLTLTETGYGKRVRLTEFRRKHRGGQGVMLIPSSRARDWRGRGRPAGDGARRGLLLISEKGQVVRTSPGTKSDENSEAGINDRTDRPPEQQQSNNSRRGFRGCDWFLLTRGRRSRGRGFARCWSVGGSRQLGHF